TLTAPLSFGRLRELALSSANGFRNAGPVEFRQALLKLRVAVASGEVQLDWQARSNGKEITVREALSTCYECGKEINLLDVACPACGAPLRAAQSSLGSRSGTASWALDFHVARKGKHFGPYTEVAARSYLADGRISADDLCWRPGMDNWMPASQVLGEQ